MQVLQGISLRAAVAAAGLITVLLLPFLILAAMTSIAWEERRLARIRCTTCGHPIGRAEVRRAKGEALRAAWAGYDPASGIRRRIAPVWRVVCPVCGHRYSYCSGDRRAALAPEQPGAGGRG